MSFLDLTGGRRKCKLGGGVVSSHGSNSVARLTDNYQEEEAPKRNWRGRVAFSRFWFSHVETLQSAWPRHQEKVVDIILHPHEQKLPQGYRSLNKENMMRGYPKGKVKGTNKSRCEIRENGRYEKRVHHQFQPREFSAATGWEMLAVRAELVPLLWLSRIPVPP